MLPGLGPNRQAKVFRWSFHQKLGSSPSLWAFDRLSSISGWEVMVLNKKID